MAALEDRENHEIFMKDSRNLKANGVSSKGRSLKEIAEREFKMAKREKQSKCSNAENTEVVTEEIESQKRYNNGKPKKELKKQEFYDVDKEALANIKKTKKRERLYEC